MLHPDTLRLILIIGSFVFLLGVIKRPFWGLISYLIIMMIRPGLYYPVLGNIRIELIVGVLMIILIFVSGRMKLLNPSTEPINKWIFILLAVMTISMLQAFDFDTSWNKMAEFVKVLIFFLMVVTLLDTRRDVEIFIWIFVLLTTLLGYEVAYNNFHGINIKDSMGGGRVDYAQIQKGMGSGHVSMSNLSLQAIPFLWFIIVSTQKKLYKLIGVLCFVICVYGVILSGSRGGFVGLVVFYVMIILFAKKRLWLICAGGLVLFLLPFISAEGYFDYILTTMDLFTGKAGLSASSRTTGLRHGIEMMIKRPLLGVGPGCYPLARKAWFGWGLWSHNHYGQLMGELGFLGLVTWFTFLYYYMKGAIDLKKIHAQIASKVTLYNAIIVATVVRLVVGYGSHSLYIFFWYMLAGIIIVEKRLYASKCKKSDKMVIKE